MKIYVLLVLSLAALCYADEEACYKDATERCTPEDKKSFLTQCDILTPSFSNVLSKLQAFAHSEIIKSYQLLLLSVYHGTYVSNRPGFEKLYRELADKSWDDGIDVIKHITKRGGKMDFSSTVDIPYTTTTRYTKNELQSLALALDIEKQINVDAIDIHQSAKHAENRLHYDPEVSQYIEEEFLEPQAGILRTLSGYVHDLSGIVDKTPKDKIVDVSLNIYLFDQYLQKQSIV